MGQIMRWSKRSNRGNCVGNFIAQPSNSILIWINHATIRLYFIIELKFIPVDRVIHNSFYTESNQIKFCRINWNERIDIKIIKKRMYI